MADFHPNFAWTTIAAPPSGAASGAALGSAIVATGDGAQFSGFPFDAVVCPNGAAPRVSNAEVVRVIGQQGDALTLQRVQEGSSRRTISVGDQIFAAVTQRTLTDVEYFLPTPTRTAARAYLTGALSPLANTWTKVPINVSKFDPGGNLDLVNHRYIAPVGGYYKVAGEVVFSTNAGFAYTVGLYLNGVLYTTGDYLTTRGTTAGDHLGQQVTDIIRLAANDYIELFVWASGATSLSVDAYYDTNFLTAARIEAL